MCFSLFRSKDQKFVPVESVCDPNFDASQVYRTVNPALAFQYVSESSEKEQDERTSAYLNNLNSWLGQTMQRDCYQVLKLYCAIMQNK